MKTIIDMAGEAGIFNGDGDWSSCREEYEGVVQRFAALVRADEREACAKVCESMRTYVDRHNAVIQSSATDCAAAIRARGQA
jgi:hypothetical protein